jgi:hypothetical protein
MKTFISPALAVLLALLTLPAFAEDWATPLQKFDDPDAKSTATGTKNRVVLEAGDADAKATIRLANLFNRGSTRFGSYSFTVSAPFDSKKADSVDVGNLSGLTSGSSAAFEYSTWWWADADQEALDDLTETCNDSIPKLIAGYDWFTVGVVTGVPCSRALFDVDKLNEVVKTINELRDECSKCQTLDSKPAPQCSSLREAYTNASCPVPPASAQRHQAKSEGEEELREQLHKSRIASCALLESEIRRECAACEAMTKQTAAKCGELKGKPEAKLAGDAKELLAGIRARVNPIADRARSPMWGLTFGVKANHQKFNYVLAAAPTTAEDSSETGVGISVGGTYVGLRNLFTFGYSHEESYTASDKTEICSPIGTTGSLSCEAASLGAPTKEKAELGFMEGKRILKSGKVAVAPRVEFDFKKSNWAIRLPVYFLANKEHQLTAGLALGYTDADDEGFGAAIFVSKAFQFFE